MFYGDIELCIKNIFKKKKKFSVTLMYQKIKSIY